MPSSVGNEADEREDDKGEEILLNVIRPDYERPAPPPPMEPLYKPREDGKVQGKSISLPVLRSKLLFVMYSMSSGIKVNEAIE